MTCGRQTQTLIGFDPTKFLINLLREESAGYKNAKWNYSYYTCYSKYNHFSSEESASSITAAMG